MRPFFRTVEVDEDFFDTAPCQFRAAFDIPRPASLVWDDLTSDSPFQWCRILQDVTWTSSRPFGVGSTRTVRGLGGLSVLHERFFRWDEGCRQSFYVVRASTPLFRRFAEDYLVKATSESSCRFEWVIAFEPRPGTRVAIPANRLMFRTLFSDTQRHYNAVDA